LAPDGYTTYYLDMGWEDIKLAVEYDGDHHRVDQIRFAYDIKRSEDLNELGWVDIRVAARHHPADVLRRVRRAWDARSR
jgi:very-short-patch-repair endonuclease